MNQKRNHKEIEKRRFKAVKYFEKGKSGAEVAKRLGVKRQSAHTWKKAWEKGGKEALRSKGRAGCKRKLTARQEKELIKILLKGPKAEGYVTEVWTLPRVRAVIMKYMGTKYHPSHLSRLLRALGFSCQRPERRALERDEKKIAHWKRETWPNIKKSKTTKTHHPIYR